jgi:AcrR family transcriptional regulator
MGRSIKGRSEQLSEEEIVDAALRLTKRVGLRNVTMRGLAGELEVTPMAAYYYVPNKDALVQLVLNAVLSQVPAPDAGAPWEDRLWTYLDNILLATQQYPGVADHLLNSDLTPAGKELIKQSLALISEGGFDDEAARLIFSAVYAYTHGRAAFQTMLASQSKHESRHRRTQRVIPSLAELASEEHAEFGYRALILGVQAALNAQVDG